MGALARLLGFRLTLGRLWGITIRAHVSLLVAAAAALLWLRDDLVAGLLFVAVLLGSVLAHELGHCWAARRVGGEAHEVVLWPLGGLASVQAPPAPWPQLVTTACGPLTNLALAGLALPPYLLLGGGWSWGPVGGPPALGWVVGINLGLAFFNLIPAYPMDGGKILHALLWPRLGWARALRASITAALVTAGVLGGWALVTGQTLLFVLMALVASAALAEREALRAGAEVPPAWSLGDERPPGPGWLAAWRERRRRARLEREAERRRALRARLDEVLAKVSFGGLDALTREERRFLRDASHELKRERERGAV